MAEKFVYFTSRLTRVYPPNKEVFRDISLSFYYGAKIGIIGVNGSGKSTLLRIMAGIDADFSGEAWIEPGRTVGYLSQEPRLDDDATVMENVALAVKQVRDLVVAFEQVSEKFAEPMSDAEMEALVEEQGRLQERIDALDGWDVDRRLEIAMDALNCPPPETPVRTLSGGERRRVALCRLLLEQPDLLLLDEPTNHLDADSVAWLERHLKEYKGSVILVTHDRYFLDNVTAWILELDRGRGIPWKGNYSSWLDQKSQRLELEGKSESQRRRRLGQELEWIRMSPRARQAKGKARLNAYEQLLAEATPDKLKSAAIVIPPGPRLGDVVIRGNSLLKAYGGNVLFENFSFDLPRAGIVGIIGANGTGKTTLFRIITGQEAPDSGTVTVGETVALCYVDQERDSLDGSKTIYEEISGGRDTLQMGKVEVNARAYVAKFNFSGVDQQKPVAALSGGERNRVHLAKLLQKTGNVLLLDEPTNDLDIETLQALENAIMAFSGCVVVISHDRYFLDRIATHICAFEGESAVFWHTGNYASYEEERRKRLGISEFQPRRIRYKALTRN